jgi:hypothetical protein
MRNNLLPERPLVALFIFTKSTILSLKILGTTAVLLLPIFLASSIKPFSGDLTCSDEYSEEIYHIARVVQREAGGEILEGKLAVIDGIRNGARGYKEGKTVDSLVRLVAKTMKGRVSHPYKHWINFELATDARQVRIAKRAIRNGRALKIGAHWFY